MAIRIVEKEKISLENTQKKPLKPRTAKLDPKAETIPNNSTENPAKRPKIGYAEQGKRNYKFKDARDAPMDVVSLRLKKETIDFFKKDGKGFTARMAECLNREMNKG